MTDTSSDQASSDHRPLHVAIVPGMPVCVMTDGSPGTIAGITQAFCIYRLDVPLNASVNCVHQLLYGEPGSVEITKPAEVIVKFAQEQDVDAIVLGTHGRSGLSHLLMGSVAEAVVRHADCPVVTIRQPRK